MSTLQELAASIKAIQEGFAAKEEDWVSEKDEMKNEYKAMIGQLKNDLEEKFKQSELEAAKAQHKHSILAVGMAAAQNDKLF